jgi:hypothetical protein
VDANFHLAEAYARDTLFFSPILRVNNSVFAEAEKSTTSKTEVEEPSENVPNDRTSADVEVKFGISFGSVYAAKARILGQLRMGSSSLTN